MLAAMRLTPFEEMMCCADSPAYPIAFFCRLRFAGTLDVARISRLVQDAAAQQPRFASTIEKVTSSRVEYYVWKPSERRAKVVCQTTTDSDADPHTPHLDLTQEVGMRLFITERQHGVTDLLFQVHHACCDGLGMAELVEEVLEAYTIESRTEWQPETERSGVTGSARQEPVTPKSEYRFLRFRLPFTLPFVLIARSVLVLRLAFLYWRHAAPLVATPPQFDAPQPHATFPSLCVRQIDRETSKRILDTARRERVTVNDILLTATYRAIETCRRAATEPADKRPLRLSIPINLQAKDSQRSAAANVVSMMFIDRRLTAATSPRRLLMSVHRAMVFAKWLDTTTLLAGLRLLKWFPRLLPHVVRNRHRLWATVVVSNLGRLFTRTPLPRTPRGEIVVGDAIGNAIGNAVLTQAIFVPPIRGLTAAAIGVTTYAETITFTLNYDGGRMTSGEAEKFLSQLIDYCETIGPN